MADDKVVSFADGAGGPAQPGQVATPTPQPLPVVKPADDQQPQYITRAEAERIAAEAAEAAYRKAQGITDKYRVKVNERLSQIEDAYKLVNGQGIPVEQRDQVRQKVEAQVQAASDDPHTPTPTQAGNVQPSQDRQGPVISTRELEYVDQMTTQIYQQAGVTIEKDDPEYGRIDFSTPLSFLGSLAAATAAKAERTKTNPLARTPMFATGSGVGNPILNVSDPNDLWEQARAKGRI